MLGWLLLGLCVLGATVMPVLRGVLPKHKSRAAALPLQRSPGVALTLSEAAFLGAGPERRIVGAVKNDSSDRATGVVVTLALHVNSDSVEALAIGKIPSIEPHATSRFQTDPVPPQVRSFFIRDIVSNKQ
jgi:hypothetical protein